MVLIDNIYVEGSSTPISRRDGEGNTYQIRKLENGAEYEVLKNFPDAADFTKSIANHTSVIEFVRFKYYWLARYQTT